MVEANLLEVKGVVSFTFEMKSGRVIIRSRTDVTVEALCAAIDSTKIMTAQQVVKDEHGQEVMLSFGTSPVRAREGPKDSMTSCPCSLSTKRWPLLTLKYATDHPTLAGCDLASRSGALTPHHVPVH